MQVQKAASPLKTRILTASILIPLFLGIILFSSSLIFSIISALLIALAAWEWTRMAGFKSIWGRSLALLAIPILLLGCLAVLQSLSNLTYNEFSFFEKLQRIMSWGILIFWVLVSVAVSLYPIGTNIMVKTKTDANIKPNTKAKTDLSNSNNLNFPDTIKLNIYQNKIVNLFIGILVLLPAWLYANLLHAISPIWLVYPIVLVCVADAAAYFTGKKWGRHHLNSKLSPGKTWEGVFGAVVAGLLVAILGFFIMKVHISFLSWLLLNLITVLFSIVGDLFESLFKRQQNLKDSGKLLPGHGGIMDRLDSLTAAIPIFAIGIIL